MKTISLKVDDSIFKETENILSHFKKPRNRYINEALEHYNKFQKRKLVEKKLKIESPIAKEESLKVLKDFEAVEYGN